MNMIERLIKNEIFSFLFPNENLMELPTFAGVLKNRPKTILEEEKDDPVFEVQDTTLKNGSKEDISWYPYVLEPKFSPEITEDFIKMLMSCDEIFRGRDGKFVGWPLFKEEEIYAAFLYYKSDFMYDDKSKLHLSMPVYGRENFRDSRTPPNRWRNNLTQHYPLVDEILMLGNGHLIVAGGSVTSTIVEYYGSATQDCDFFFIGYNNEEDAFNLLREVVEYIENYVQEFNQKHDTEVPIYITRSQNVTTVNIGGCYGVPKMEKQILQFVHRVYPDTGNLETNISLVLGGFDLFSCAVAYYNEQFYATPAGVFALATGLNIVMTSRFSTSMAKRLGKYKERHFGILFPGTSREIMSKKSLAARYAYRNGESMPINLPYMKFGFRSSGEFNDDSDYEVKNADGETGILSRKLNLKVLAAGKLEQYCVYGNTWNEVFYPKTFTNNPVVGETKFKGYSRIISDKLIAKNAKSATAQKYFLAQDWANPAISPRLSAMRNRIFENFNKILQVELEAWLDTSETLEVIIFHISFFEIEQKEFDQLRTLRLKIKNFENESQKEQNETLQIYQRAMRALIRKCCEEIICFDEIANNLFYTGVLPKLTSYVKENEAKAIQSLHENPCMSSKNPMRQHTSSFNPIPARAVDWYGVENYVPFRVGFPDEIYFLVKQLGTRYGINAKVLAPYFARAWAEDKMQGFKRDVMEQFSNNMHYVHALNIFIQNRYQTREEVIETIYVGHSNPEIRKFQKIPKLPKVKIVFSEETKAKMEKDRQSRIKRAARKSVRKVVKKTDKAKEDDEEGNDNNKIVLPRIQSPRGLDE